MHPDPLATSFGANAPEYSAFCPSYPTVLYSLLYQQAQDFRCAADLGAGTGIVTRELARQFSSVTAVEPDSRLLRQLKLAPNIQLQTLPAQQAQIPSGSCNLITCANSFYWMEAETLLPKIKDWLSPQGLFAAWRYPFPTVLQPRVQNVLQNQLHIHWNSFRHHRLPDTAYTRRSLYQSGLFSDVRLYSIPYIVQLTAHQLAGFFASTSYAGAFFRQSSGGKTAARKRLEEKLAEAFAEDTVSVSFDLELVLAGDALLPTTGFPPMAGILFEEEPLQWGYRGDPYLWRELYLHMRSTPLPLSMQALVTLLENAYHSITGHPLSHSQAIPLPQYNFGGMSGGLVNPVFWQTKGLPLLYQRYASLLPFL